MIKVIRAFSVFLLMSLLLTGCTRTAPNKATDSTPTTVPTTEVTEPPTEVSSEATEAAKPAMTAENLYWKMRYATGGSRANQYTTQTQLNMRIGANGVFMRTNTASTTRVVMSGDPFAINVETQEFATYMDVEIEQTYHDYYRMEGNTPVLYYYLDTLDVYGREELDIPVLDLITSYSTGAYTLRLPDDIALAEATEVFDGREAYIVTFTVPALEYFGETGSAELDAALADIRVPYQYYIDTETYLPLQIQISLHDMDEIMSAVIYSDYGDMLTEDMSDMEVQVSEYTITVTDMIFTQVEVPEIPEDVLQGAKDSAGYTAA